MLRTFDHVIVGQDVAIGAHDDARAFTNQLLRVAFVTLAAKKALKRRVFGQRIAGAALRAGGDFDD